MHWVLKVISLGHVRTFTHHRLLLLEQKFNLHVMLNAGEEGGIRGSLRQRGGRLTDRQAGAAPARGQGRMAVHHLLVIAAAQS